MWFLLLSLWTKYHGVTIRMKPLQRYFHMVLFISYVVVVTFKSWMKSYGVTIHETSLAALLHGAINLVGLYKRDFWTFGEFVLICYCPEWTGLKHYRGRGAFLTDLVWLASVRVLLSTLQHSSFSERYRSFYCGWFTEDHKGLPLLL